MGLRINTNLAALNATRVLNNTTQDLNKSIERLSSGLRINRAADDASGLSIAEGFRSVVSGTQMAARNAQDGINLVQTADGGLSVMGDILQRMRELAVQAATDTQTAESRQYLQDEVTELVEQINSIAADTEFNGISLLDGTDAADLTLQVGAMQGQEMTVAIEDADATALGVATIDLTANDGADARTAIDTIDDALDDISEWRSNLGALQNRLEFTIQNLNIQEENSAASESAIRDADMARESIQFTRNQILQQAGTGMLAQANISPQTALQLLG